MSDEAYIDAAHRRIAELEAEMARFRVALSWAGEALIRLLSAINGVMPEYAYLRECEKQGQAAVAAIRKVLK